MAEKSEKREMEELTVPVAGMTCAACVTTIEKAAASARRELTLAHT